MKLGSRLKKIVSLCLVFIMSISVLSSGSLISGAAESQPPDDESGSDLWLRYVPVLDAALKAEYGDVVKSIVVQESLAEDLYRFADTELYEEAYGTSGIQQPDGAKEVVPESTLKAARLELERGLAGLLGNDIPVSATPATLSGDGAVIIGTPESSTLINGLNLDEELKAVGDEGYIIRSVTIGGFKATAIAANSEIGALYGTFQFLQRMQTGESIRDLDISDYPKINHRRLNGWDRERMYGGNNVNSWGNTGTDGESGYIFNWDLSPQTTTGNTAHSSAPAIRLPIVLDRYIVFARACASVGINEININNVNTNAAYMTEYVIRQVASLADALRPYGVKISISVNYGMPTMAVCNQTGATYPKDDTSVIGTAGATTCSPYNEAYQNWWYDKSVQVMKKIPDFLGYTVKANSEGQSGPQTYGFSHAEGANAIAYRLQELGLTVFWRSFVYNASVDNDRLNRAYMEFGPHDDAKDNPLTQPFPENERGVANMDKQEFLPNVFVQTKNGPLDFQPREPFHPMFGRMPNTNQAVEFQITQEYTGHNTMLCFLAPMWEEILKSDTYAGGEGTLVGNVLDGSAQGHQDTAMVGVHNLGNSENFTNHQFGQANFYAFGRQSWNWEVTSEEIAEDWAKMTWSTEPKVVSTVVDMMMGSWEALVSYQEPFGLMHQQYGTGSEHYPPVPWDYSGQDDWGPAYYNKADSQGLGWNRTEQGRVNDSLPIPEPGSGNEKYYPLVNQYYPEVRDMFANIETCPEEYLLAFHHVSWDYEMKSGKTLWEELVYRHQTGVQYVSNMLVQWDSLEGLVDDRRWEEVRFKLNIQEADAARWRDEMTSYWQSHSRLDYPTDTAPLSAKVVIGGKEYGGFNLSWTVDPNSTASLNSSDPRGTNSGRSPYNAKYRSYVIGVPYGTEDFTITAVNLYDPEAKYEITKQAGSMSDTAQLTVTKNDFFGEIRQNYTFEFAYDTTLTDIRVNGVSVEGFKPSKTVYSAFVTGAPTVTATPGDPAATVEITQAEARGAAKITVSNHGAPETTYTVYLGDGTLGVDDGFDGGELGSQWEWLDKENREDSDNWSLTKNPGAMTITTQGGTLTAGTAKNVLLQDAPGGDWTIEAKLDFSRAPLIQNEEAGIIAYTNDNSYITVGWRRASASGTTPYNIAIGIKNGGSTLTTYATTGGDVQRAAGASVGTGAAAGQNPTVTILGDEIWLRIEKKGNSYMCYYSSNGVNFKTARFYSGTPTSAPKPPTLSFEPAKVGVYTFNNAAAVGDNGPMDVMFDYFRITNAGGNLPSITSVGVDARIRSLVSGYAANIPVTVGTENADGMKVYAGLFLDNSPTPVAKAEVIGGSAVIKSGAFDFDTACVIAWFEGSKPDYANGVEIPAVTLPTDIWKPTGWLDTMPGNPYTVILNFASKISLTQNSAATVYGVRATNCSVRSSEHPMDGTIWFLNIWGFGDITPSEGNDKVKVSGVKYPDLFPSYSFTFEIAVTRIVT